jgi:hypothetical protein
MEEILLPQIFYPYLTSLSLGKPSSMALKIFFSHAWADKAGANVKTLMNALKDSKGLDLWIDRYEMDLSEDIDAAVEASVKNSDVVVVAWSKNANTNKNVAFELKAAKKYKKPIVPCIIDGFPTNDSKLVKGLKWVEITGNNKHDIPQLSFLNDYLIKLGLNKLESSVQDENIKKQTADLKKKHKSSSNLLKELEDIHYRQKKGESGNEASDVYVQSALKEAISLTSLDSNDKIQEFFKRMMEATIKFPGKENDKKKTEYLLQTLIDLDPDQRDADFQKFCKAGLSTFGLIPDNPATSNDVSPAPDVGIEVKAEIDEETPSGDFYDNQWFGVRLYLGDGRIEETYPNGCKIHFPGSGTATIYFLYNFHKELNAVADFLKGCIVRMRSQGTEYYTSENFDVSETSVAVEMAYYNNGQLQYEYLGGYCLNDNRGFFMEILTSDQTVTKLFRTLFANNAYLLNDQEPGSKIDPGLFQRIANRKLFSLSSSSSGYGSFYSSSSDQKHFKLFETGEFSYYYLATNYSSGVGSLNNESSGSGRWGVYTENSQHYMWFKWNEGQYELCELRFGNDGDLYLGNAKYFIVSHDYRV